jgi:hypothetical protein
MSVQDSSGNLLEPSFVFTCPCIWFQFDCS